MQQWLYSVVVVLSHYHQSVFLLSEDMSVSAGADLLRVTGRTRDGYINIQIDTDNGTWLSVKICTYFIF